MNYYIFCYRSTSGLPDLAEAQLTIEQYEAYHQLDPNLTDVIQKLEAYCPAMVKSCVKTPYFTFTRRQDGRAKSFQHTVLKGHDESDLRFSIYNDNISIEVPFKSSQLKAEEALERALACVSIICKLTGYFVYNPQTGQVFNPLLSCFDGSKDYYALGHKMLCS